MSEKYRMSKLPEEWGSEKEKQTKKMKPSRELEIGNQGSESERNKELLKALNKMREKNIEKLQADEEIPDEIQDAEKVEDAGLIEQDGNYFLIIKKNGGEKAFRIPEESFGKIAEAIRRIGAYRSGRHGYYSGYGYTGYYPSYGYGEYQYPYKSKYYTPYSEPDKKVGESKSNRRSKGV